MRKYLGVVPLSAEEVDRYREESAYEMELRAAKKRALLSSTFYKSKYLTRKQVRIIEEIRYIYKTFTKLLTVNETAVYERAFEISYIQGTTSIEGNTLSLDQTSDLLINNIAPNDKSLREINEVQNFINVKRYRDKYRGKVTIDFVKTPFFDYE